MIYEGIVFDLDGTLLDTLGDIANSSNEVLASRGLPTHDRNLYKQFVGNGVKVLFERAIPTELQTDNLIAECCEGFKSVYAENWNVETTIYEGIAELLDALASNDIRRAVLSNKPHEATVVCVREFLANWTFDVVRGQQDPIPPKPDPGGAIEIANTIGLDTGRILYVGDTNVDMQTATNAGMQPIGVSWGFRPVEELVENGAKQIIDHPRELLEILGI